MNSSRQSPRFLTVQFIHNSRRLVSPCQIPLFVDYAKVFYIISSLDYCEILPSILYKIPIRCTTIRVSLNIRKYKVVILLYSRNDNNGNHRLNILFLFFIITIIYIFMLLWNLLFTPYYCRKSRNSVIYISIFMWFKDSGFRNWFQTHCRRF